MKGVDRQTFSIKCECIITRNDLTLNTKKKSKFSTLQLNPNTQAIQILPFGVQK